MTLFLLRPTGLIADLSCFIHIFIPANKQQEGIAVLVNTLSLLWSIGEKKLLWWGLITAVDYRLLLNGICKCIMQHIQPQSHKRHRGSLY